MRSTSVRGIVGVLVLGVLGLEAAHPKEPADAVPQARQVVVRGGRDLGDLLARATRPAWQSETDPRAVALIVDVTPHTRRARDEVEDALRTIGSGVLHLKGQWQAAPLGGRLSPVLRHPTALANSLDAVFAAETPEVDTVGALRKTLRGFSKRNGVVVYLADWRFEDERKLETFIRALRAKNTTFNVIGSEACFERGWNDGLPERSLGRPEYVEGIGRSPFGTPSPKAPWHGGDTAYPHVPYSFSSLPWRTEFAVTQRGLHDMEDLADRLRNGTSVLEKTQRSAFSAFPLPSGFGPYGLMRAAGLTGGRYYVYSFNPEGRSDLVYDYGRVNHFPPDLRPRREILSHARSHKVARALLEVWHLLSEPAIGVVDVTPPLTAAGRPAEVERVHAPRSLALYWPEKSDYRKFLRDAEDTRDDLDTCLDTLDRALGSPAKDETDVDRRYRADARLLRHTLAVLRFEVAEAIVTARELPANAWDDEDVTPGITKEDWIRPADGVDDAPIRHGPGRPRDEEAGARLEAARREHLRRFAGTPYGATVAKNGVTVWRLHEAPSPSSLRGGDRERSPAESQDPPPTTPPVTPPPVTPPGGSTGSGPSTGR